MNKVEDKKILLIRQIFIFFSFWLGSSLFAILMMQTIAKGMGINDWQFLIEQIKNGKYLTFINHIKIISIVGHFCTYTLTALSFVYFLYRNKPFKYLKLDTFKKPVNIFLITLSIISVYPIALWVAYFNLKIVPDNWIAENTLIFEQRLMQMNTISDLMLNIALLGIIAGIGEELIFRGIIQKIIAQTTNKITLSIWLSGLFFSIIHFQPEGFVPRLLLGVFFGYILFWTGSLWYSIIAHILFNSLQVVIFYYFVDTKKIEILNSMPEIPIWLTIILLLIFSITVYIIKKINRFNNINKADYCQLSVE